MERLGRGSGIVGVAAVGFLLSVIHATRLLSAPPSPEIAVEAGGPLLLSAFLVPAAVWLNRHGFDATELGRVWAWIAVGVVAMGVITAWTVGVGVSLTSGAPFVLLSNVTAGVALGVVLGAYDVTTRRREHAYGEARETLQRERDRLAALFESVPNPTVYYEHVDGDPIVRDVNPAFEDVFGYAESEVRGSSIDAYIVPPDARSEANRLNDRLMNEDLQASVTRTTAEGEREFLLYTVMLPDDPHRGFATYVDITDQRRSEQRLQVLNRVLRHDLRNAMNVIVGHADNIAAGREGVTDREAAETIRARAEDLLSKSRKAREVERLLNADDTPCRTVNVAAVAAARVELAERVYPELTVTLSCPEGSVWASVNEQFRVAIDNLLENAAVHGGGDATLHVEDGDPVRLILRDRGPGIPDAEIEPLTREEETKLEHTSGLGLWIVTWVVRDADGDVSVSNHEDGAEVLLELPGADPPESVEGDE
ncbi:hypothetical protein JCM17823_19300 [Halorubrum gandharaense]